MVCLNLGQVVSNGDQDSHSINSTQHMCISRQTYLKFVEDNCYTIKSTYHQVMDSDNFNKASSSGTMGDLWRNIWKVPLILKCRNFIWVQRYFTSMPKLKDKNSVIRLGGVNPVNPKIGHMVNPSILFHQNYK